MSLLCFGILQIFRGFYGFLQKKEKEKRRRKKMEKGRNKRERDELEGNDFLKFRENAKNKIKIGIR